MTQLALQRPPDTAVKQLLNEMAQLVGAMLDRAIESLLSGDDARLGHIFMYETDVNELQIRVDELAVQQLRTQAHNEAELRGLVAALKVNTDLERMADLAVNIGQRVISLAQLPEPRNRQELQPMGIAVAHMARKALRALTTADLMLAKSVLSTEATVDSYRDYVFQQLSAHMHAEPSGIGADVDLLLASRHLERVADHATNIAEDVIYWVRGIDVRHGHFDPEELA